MQPLWVQIKFLLFMYLRAKLSAKSQKLSFCHVSFHHNLLRFVAYCHKIQPLR